MFKKLLYCSFLTFFNFALADVLEIPHLDLEMTTYEYRQLLKDFKSKESDPAIIQKALKYGERLSKWLAFENKNRTAENQLRLSDPTLRRGIPIDKPKIYSPKTVEEKMTTVLSEMPQSMKDILTSSGDFPSTLPLKDEEFILHARLVNGLYDTSARWKMLNPYRAYYETARFKDVRGLHFLETNKWTAARLDSEYDRLSREDKKSLDEALVRICLNSTSNQATCDKEFANNTDKKAFYTKYIKHALKILKEFYNIPTSGIRRDVTWKKENLTQVPFNTPSVARIIPYLRDNIQAEWKWKGWQLELVFGSYDNGPKVVFQPGVTPHVNGLGGNDIVMDANESIDEYSSKWTIRHEFGHVLGLPDCYHEFFDPKLDAYVNYQLDTTDLMCSRAGDMTERIYNEMKRVYFKAE